MHLKKQRNERKPDPKNQKQETEWVSELLACYNQQGKIFLSKNMHLDAQKALKKTIILFDAMDNGEICNENEENEILFIQACSLVGFSYFIQGIVQKPKKYAGKAWRIAQKYTELNTNGKLDSEERNMAILMSAFLNMMVQMAEEKLEQCIRTYETIKKLMGKPKKPEIFGEGLYIEVQHQKEDEKKPLTQKTDGFCEKSDLCNYLESIKSRVLFQKAMKEEPNLKESNEKKSILASFQGEVKKNQESSSLKEICLEEIDRFKETEPRVVKNHRHLPSYDSVLDFRVSSKSSLTKKTSQVQSIYLPVELTGTQNYQESLPFQSTRVTSPKNARKKGKRISLDPSVISHASEIFITQAKKNSMIHRKCYSTQFQNIDSYRNTSDTANKNGLKGSSGMTFHSPSESMLVYRKKRLDLGQEKGLTSRTETHWNLFEGIKTPAMKNQGPFGVSMPLTTRESRKSPNDVLFTVRTQANIHRTSDLQRPNSSVLLFENLTTRGISASTSNKKKKSSPPPPILEIDAQDLVTDFEKEFEGIEKNTIQQKTYLPTKNLKSLFHTRNAKSATLRLGVPTLSGDFDMEKRIAPKNEAAILNSELYKNAQTGSPVGAPQLSLPFAAAGLIQEEDETSKNTEEAAPVVDKRKFSIKIQSASGSKSKKKTEEASPLESSRTENQNNELLTIKSPNPGKVKMKSPYAKSQMIPKPKHKSSLKPGDKKREDLRQSQRVSRHASQTDLGCIPEKRTFRRMKNLVYKLKKKGMLQNGSVTTSPEGKAITAFPGTQNIIKMESDFEELSRKLMNENKKGKDEAIEAKNDEFIKSERKPSNTNILEMNQEERSAKMIIKFFKWIINGKYLGVACPFRRAKNKVFDSQKSLCIIKPKMQKAPLIAKKLANMEAPPFEIYVNMRQGPSLLRLELKNWKNFLKNKRINISIMQIAKKGQFFGELRIDLKKNMNLILKECLESQTIFPFLNKLVQQELEFTFYMPKKKALPRSGGFYANKNPEMAQMKDFMGLVSSFFLARSMLKLSLVGSRFGFLSFLDRLFVTGMKKHMKGERRKLEKRATAEIKYDEQIIKSKFNRRRKNNLPFIDFEGKNFIKPPMHRRLKSRNLKDTRKLTIGKKAAQNLKKLFLRNVWKIRNDPKTYSFPEKGMDFDVSLAPLLVGHFISKPESIGFCSVALWIEPLVPTFRLMRFGFEKVIEPSLFEFKATLYYFLNRRVENKELGQESKIKVSFESLGISKCDQRELMAVLAGQKPKRQWQIELRKRVLNILPQKQAVSSFQDLQEVQKKPKKRDSQRKKLRILNHKLSSSKTSKNSQKKEEDLLLDSPQIFRSTRNSPVKSPMISKKRITYIKPKEMSPPRRSSFDPKRERAIEGNLFQIESHTEMPKFEKTKSVNILKKEEEPPHKREKLKIPGLKSDNLIKGEEQRVQSQNDLRKLCNITSIGLIDRSYEIREKICSFRSREEPKEDLKFFGSAPESVQISRNIKSSLSGNLFLENLGTKFTSFQYYLTLEQPVEITCYRFSTELGGQRAQLKLTLDPAKCKLFLSAYFGSTNSVLTYESGILAEFEQACSWVSPENAHNLGVILATQIALKRGPTGQRLTILGQIGRPKRYIKNQDRKRMNYSELYCLVLTDRDSRFLSEKYEQNEFRLFTNISNLGICAIRVYVFDSRKFMTLNGPKQIFLFEFYPTNYKSKVCKLAITSTDIQRALGFRGLDNIIDCKAQLISYFTRFVLLFDYQRSMVGGKLVIPSKELHQNVRHMSEEYFLQNEANFLDVSPRKMREYRMGESITWKNIGRTTTHAVSSVKEKFLVPKANDREIVLQIMKRINGQYCLVTIEKCFKLSAFVFRLYFPQTCRRFVCYLYPNDLMRMDISFLEKVQKPEQFQRARQASLMTKNNYNDFRSKILTQKTEREAQKIENKKWSEPINDVFKLSSKEKVKTKILRRQASSNLVYFKPLPNYEEIFMWEQLAKEIKIVPAEISGKWLLTINNFHGAIREVLHSDTVTFKNGKSANVEVVLEECRNKSSPFESLNVIYYHFLKYYSLFIKIQLLDKMTVSNDRINLKDMVLMAKADGISIGYMPERLKDSQEDQSSYLLCDLKLLGQYSIQKIHQNYFSQSFSSSPASSFASRVNYVSGNQNQKQVKYHERNCLELFPIRESSNLKLNSQIQMDLMMQGISPERLVLFKEVFSLKPKKLMIVALDQISQEFCFFVYNATSSETFEKKIPKKEAKKTVPSIKSLIKKKKFRELGQRLFKAFKNNLIISMYLEKRA